MLTRLIHLIMACLTWQDQPQTQTHRHRHTHTHRQGQTGVRTLLADAGSDSKAQNVSSGYAHKDTKIMAKEQHHKLHSLRKQGSTDHMSTCKSRTLKDVWTLIAEPCRQRERERSLTVEVRSCLLMIIHQVIMEVIRYKTANAQEGGSAQTQAGQCQGQESKSYAYMIQKKAIQLVITQLVRICNCRSHDLLG